MAESDSDTFIDLTADSDSECDTAKYDMGTCPKQVYTAWIAWTKNFPTLTEALNQLMTAKNCLIDIADYKFNHNL